MIKMGIQFGLFVLIYIYYLCNGYSLMVNGYAWLAPLLLLMLAGLGLGFGLLISSLTTKYRDLRFLITFGVQLWMYATPVSYTHLWFGYMGFSYFYASIIQLC